jgi:hypothetical protein
MDSIGQEQSASPGTNSIGRAWTARNSIGQEQSASPGTNSIARNKQHHGARTVLAGNKQHRRARTALARHEQHRSGTGSIGQERTAWSGTNSLVRNEQPGQAVAGATKPSRYGFVILMAWPRTRARVSVSVESVG